MTKPTGLFIIDPLHTLNPKKDSSLAMMQAAEQAGHEIFITTIDHVMYKNSVQARVSPWRTPNHASTLDLSSFSYVMMRKDPPVDAHYIYATHLLSKAKKAGTLIFNDPDFLRNHHEKIAILDFPEHIPETLVSSSAEAILAFIEEHQHVILKPLHGMGGEGIFYIHVGDPNTKSIIEALTRHEETFIMAQRYLSEITQGDKRVFLIGGKVYPIGVLRIPQANTIRANLAQGGKAQACSLTNTETRIAREIAETLGTAHTLLIGLDMIGEHLTEINITSPTCLVPIQEQTQENPALEVIHCINALL